MTDIQKWSRWWHLGLAKEICPRHEDQDKTYLCKAHSEFWNTSMDLMTGAGFNLSKLFWGKPRAVQKLKSVVRMLIPGTNRLNTKVKGSKEGTLTKMWNEIKTTKSSGERRHVRQIYGKIFPLILRLSRGRGHMYTYCWFTLLSA